jgi:hypothetical protein
MTCNNNNNFFVTKQMAQMNEKEAGLGVGL